MPTSRGVTTRGTVIRTSSAGSATGGVSGTNRLPDRSTCCGSSTLTARPSWWTRPTHPTRRTRRWPSSSTSWQPSGSRTDRTRLARGPVSRLAVHEPPRARAIGVHDVQARDQRVPVVLAPDEDPVTSRRVLVGPEGRAPGHPQRDRHLGGRHIHRADAEG